MTQPFFTSNDAELTRLEQLYVQETAPPAQITSVSLSAGIFVGQAVRGPTGKVVDTSSGPTRFKDVWGWRDQGAGGAVFGGVESVWAGVLNKIFGTFGVVRATAASSSVGFFQFPDVTPTNIVKVAAANSGSWSTNLQADVEAATDGNANHFDCVITYLGATYRLKNVDCSGTNDTTATAVSQVWPDADTALVKLTKLAAGRPLNAAATYLVGGGDGLVANPAVPTITPTGGAAATWTYKVVAVTTTGVTTAASPAGSTAAGAATLTTTNYNTVAWSAVAGAVSYNVYRTVSGGTPSTLGLIASVSADAPVLQYLDKGGAGDASTAPAVNSTAAIADADYTATGGPLELAAAYKGPLGTPTTTIYGWVDCRRMNVNIKTKMAALAALAVDRMFLVGADNETITDTAAETDAALNQSDRLIYCFNHYYTLDPETSTQLLTDPRSLMASILAGVDVDIDPGEEATKKFTAGVVSLYWANYSRSNYIGLRAGGVAGLEQDGGASFVSAVTTSLTPGKERITRRRMADALLLAMSANLKFQVKKKNTATRRAMIKAICDNYLFGLKDIERIVADAQVIINPPSQSTPTVQPVTLNIQLINHILSLVLKANIGTTVTITQTQ